MAAVRETHDAHLLADLARRGVPGSLAEDVLQKTYQNLFVGLGEGPPKIVQYSGRGPLRAWLAVVAHRQALNLIARQREETGMDLELLEQLAPLNDPELAHLKSHYRAELKRAFAEALAVLSAQERNLLCYRGIDGLTCDEIANLYGVHQTTVSRWLSKICAKLYSHTRRALTDKLHVGLPEFESILRLVESQLDLSMHRLLSTEAPTHEDTGRGEG